MTEKALHRRFDPYLRSAKLFYKGTQDNGGLNSYRYWGTNHTFANGSTVPGNECYCVGSTCAPMGRSAPRGVEMH